MDGHEYREGDTLIPDLGVAAILGISRATVWRRVNDGTLPQPIRLAGVTRWSRAEIQALITRALAARDGEPAEALIDDEADNDFAA